MTKEEIRGKIEEAQQKAAQLRKANGNRIEIWYNAETDDIQLCECTGNTYMVSNAPYMFQLSSTYWPQNVDDIYAYKEAHGLPVSEEDKAEEKREEQEEQEYKKTAAPSVPKL